MIWETDGLPKQPLEEVLEPEMVKQYRIRRGKQCVYMPVFTEDRWLCACGAENGAGENCHACGLSPEPLTRQVLEQLRQDAAVRLEEEEKTRDQREEAQRRAALAAKRKKRMKIVAIWASCVVAAVALVAGTWAFLRYGLPELYYRQALTALDRQDIPKAYRLFVLARGHKDADDYLSRFYTPLQTAVGTTSYTDEAQFDDQMPETIQTTALYTYDSFGRLLTSKEETLQSDWQESEQAVYTNVYDEKGNCLVRENGFGKLVRQYDDRGSVRMEEHYKADGTHDYSKIFVIEYDEQGRVKASSEVCSDHVLVNYSYEQHLTFTYDDRGNLVKQTNVTNFPATSESNYEVTILWSYNDRNDPLSMESDMICPDDPVDNCREETTWVYDAEGRLLSQDALKEYPNNPMATFRTVYTCTYDEKGRVLTETTMGTFPSDPDRDYEETKVCTYDREGRLAQERNILRYEGQERNHFAGFSSVETYTYDILGRCKEKVLVKDYSNVNLSYTEAYAYTYGLDGSLCKAKGEYTYFSEDGGQNCTAITYYNENGLPQRVETVSENTTNTREYTYGYYYYPEGVEMPQNDVVTTEILYG